MSRDLFPLPAPAMIDAHRRTVQFTQSYYAVTVMARSVGEVLLPIMQKLAEDIAAFGDAIKGIDLD